MTDEKQEGYMALRKSFPKFTDFLEDMLGEFRVEKKAEVKGKSGIIFYEIYKGSAYIGQAKEVYAQDFETIMCKIAEFDAGALQTGKTGERIKLAHSSPSKKREDNHIEIPFP